MTAASATASRNKPIKFDSINQHIDIIDVFYQSGSGLGEGARPARPRWLVVRYGGVIESWSDDARAGQAVATVEPGVRRAAYHAPTGYLALVYDERVEIVVLPVAPLVPSVPIHKREPTKFRPYVVLADARLKARVTALDFSPHGDALLLGAVDGEVYRWRFEYEQQVQTRREQEKVLESYFGHASVIGAVKYHPAGRVFFSADWDGKISAWQLYDADPQEGKFDRNALATDTFAERVKRMSADRSPPQMIEGLWVTPDSEFIVVALESGLLELWQVRGFKKVTDIQAHKGRIFDVALAADGSQLLSLGRDDAVRQWTIERRETEQRGIFEYQFKLRAEGAAEGARLVRYRSAVGSAPVPQALVASGSNVRMLSLSPRS